MLFCLTNWESDTCSQQNKVGALRGTALLLPRYDCHRVESNTESAKEKAYNSLCISCDSIFAVMSVNGLLPPASSMSRFSR
jgi:hypothetical protein